MSIGQIEHISPHELRANPRNARTHSKKQIQQIADSIRIFGWTNPILIDAQTNVIVGHARLSAGKLLKLETVPCIRLESMTPDQKRAYAIADNKLALNAGWDEEILVQEFGHLLSVDLDFDIGVIGFGIPEIDSLIAGQGAQEAGDPRDDQLPDIDAGPPVSRLGDLWELDQHRVINASALEVATYSALLGEEKAEMVFTDPPYNVRIAGNVGGLGAIQHREFQMGAGEMSSEQFTGFLTNSFQNIAAHTVDGAIAFICMDWRHMREILAAGHSIFSELKNLIVWVKDNGGMGTFYRSRQELIFAFKVGSAAHINNFELGQHGRYRTNVWEYKGMNSRKPGRMDELALHPTVKPVEMIADAIKDVSRRNGIVLDVFGGSGSTLIAAHKTGRRAYLCELDPIYVDRTIRRWQAYAHDDAVLASTGQRFGEVARIRGSRPKEGSGSTDDGKTAAGKVEASTARAAGASRGGR